MAQPKHMYFDDVLARYLKQVEAEEPVMFSVDADKEKKVGIKVYNKPKSFLDLAILNSFLPKHPVNALEEERKRHEKEVSSQIKRHLVDILDESKVFLINGAVVDDLYNIPSDTTNYEATMHLPFPIIFFELIDSVEITMLRGEKIHVKAMLFGEGKDAGAACRWVNENISTHSTPGTFYVGLFYKEMKPDDLPLDIYIDPTSFHNLETEKLFTACNPFEMSDYTQQADRTATAKIINLCVNVVDYINAHNVTIMKTNREETRNLGKINRKRRKKGRKEFDPLKQYYWVKIREITISASEAQRRGEEAYKMDYKEWVRGHFQKYHLIEGIVKYWISNYIRGPLDAPWKEKRYEVKETMLQKGPSYWKEAANY